MCMCGMSPVSSRDHTVRQMLWWGMDVARHSSTNGFNGNLMDEFRATIGEEEYGLDKTPSTIGLHGGRYTIRF